MASDMKERMLTQDGLDAFKESLILEEKSVATVDKYLRDVRAFSVFADGRVVSKAVVMAYTVTRQIISERYPEYIPAYDRWMARTYGHHFNMFVMKKPWFDAYCQWLFSILFELEKRLDIADYDEYNKRVFGFVSERLIDCWLETNRLSYTEMPVVFMENQHWPRKICRFLRRKIAGSSDHL